MAKTMEEVLERFRTIEFHDDFDMIVAIANGGIVPAGIINQRLQKEVHLLRINLRDEYQHPKYDAPLLYARSLLSCKNRRNALCRWWGVYELTCIYHPACL
jgi:adenine/guanine phosphoribosyltransferase-like PRPP-binding protein